MRYSPGFGGAHSLAQRESAAQVRPLVMSDIEHDNRSASPFRMDRVTFKMGVEVSRYQGPRGEHVRHTVNIVGSMQQASRDHGTWDGDEPGLDQRLVERLRNAIDGAGVIRERGCSLIPWLRKVDSNVSIFGEYCRDSGPKIVK